MSDLIGANYGEVVDMEMQPLQNKIRQSQKRIRQNMNSTKIRKHNPNKISVIKSVVETNYNQDEFLKLLKRLGLYIDSKEFKIQNIDNVKCLGQGNYSSVYKIEVNGKYAAVKVLKPQRGLENDKMMRSFLDEVGILAEVSDKDYPCDNVSHIIGAYKPGKDANSRSEIIKRNAVMKNITDNYIKKNNILSLQEKSKYELLREFHKYPNIVMPFYDLGDLHSYLKSDKGGDVIWHTVLHWSYQLTQALIHLSNLNIVHRDIAARNIMLSSSSNNQGITIKLIDFGLSRHGDQIQII